MVKWRRSILWVLGMVSGAGWLATGAAASPLLSEVYYDAVGSDDGQLFVEIAGTPGTSLEGFVIEGINGSNGAAGPTILLSGSIGSDGLFVIADQTSEGSTSVLGADLLANFDFQNGPDSVVLRNGDLPVDALGYGVFEVDEVFAGEGNAAPDAAAGSSLARLFANLDTQDNFADFEVLTTPTPGVASFAPVPEPGAGLMIGLGLSGLAFAGGRHRSAASPRLPSPKTSVLTSSGSNGSNRRKGVWPRRSIGSISGRVELPAPERPGSWTHTRS